MRFLIFHGYLLRGTGSNIYNANLVRTLAAPGPRGASALPGPGTPGAAWRRAFERSVHDLRTSGACCPSTWPTRTRASMPSHIAELTDEELEHYIEANVEAVREVPTARTWPLPITWSWGP